MCKKGAGIEERPIIEILLGNLVIFGTGGNITIGILLIFKRNK